MAKLLYDRKKPLPTHATKNENLMTIYDLEYTNKCQPRTKPYIPPELMPEFVSTKPDPLSEPFRQDLLPDYEIDRAEAKENLERGDDYFERLREKKPSIIKVVDSAVCQNVLRGDHELFDGRTVYQVDYCKIGDYILLGQSELKSKPIPDAWKPVPPTLYQLNYRDHSKLAPWKITPEPAKMPPSFFDPKPEERAILNVSTGRTQYQAVIGQLGTEIMKREYHGHVQSLPGEFVAQESKTPSTSQKTSVE